MTRSLRTGTPPEFNLEIEKISRKLKKEATKQKQSAMFFVSSSSLAPEISTPQGSRLWNEPQITVSSFLKVPSSSNSPFKKYSPPSSQKSEPIDSSKTGSKKAVMSDLEDDQENTLREWATQEVTQEPLCITFLESRTFKLKSDLIHLLPTFRGLKN